MDSPVLGGAVRGGPLWGKPPPLAHDAGPGVFCCDFPPDPPSPDEVGESDVDEEPPEASLVEPEMDV